MTKNRFSTFSKKKLKKVEKNVFFNFFPCFYTVFNIFPFCISQAEGGANIMMNDDDDDDDDDE